MLDRVIYLPDARRDVLKAYRWYEARAVGVGEEFLRQLGEGVERIRRDPESYPVAMGSFRRALLHRYPYEVFYRADGDALVISSVFHCSRDPRRWQRRIHE